MGKKIVIALILTLFMTLETAAKRTRGAARPLSVLKRSFGIKRRSNTCRLVTCLGEGATCSNSSDGLDSICKGGIKCVDGKCKAFKEGDGCYNNNECSEYYYCDDDDKKCHAMKQEGDACAGYNFGECTYGLYCNTSYNYEDRSVCLPYPTKVGDNCSMETEYCPDGTKCVYGFCVIYPATAGADCDENPGCNGVNLTCHNGKCMELPSEHNESCFNTKCAQGLYCNLENKCNNYAGAGEECNTYGFPKCANEFYCGEDQKCERFPSDGENCTSEFRCAADNYCDIFTNVCVKRGDLGERCSSDTCKSGLFCNSTDHKCYKSVSGEGGYCSYYNSNCEAGLVCNLVNNTCVIGECYSDLDCPSDKGCHNFNCIDFMSLNDGEECGVVENIQYRGFFCKEGGGCGRNESSSTGYSCMKITTKISDEIECEDDKDCPSDSYCECNTGRGEMQCVPYLYSNATGLEYYKSIAYFEDLDGLALKYLYDMYFPYDEETRCNNDFSALRDDVSSSGRTVPAILFFNICLIYFFICIFL